MGQPSGRSAAHLTLWLLLIVLTSCDKKPSSAATQPAGVTVASLVPAATDLILAMGSGDRLVAVSNYDSAEITGRKLPHVGDYQTTDWETLASLRPTVMVIEMDPGRLAPGFSAKTRESGIKLVDVRLNSLDDILDGARRLGREMGDAEKGAKLADTIAARINAVRKKSAGKPPIRTLLTMDERGEHLIGVGEFLNDALVAAGGENVAASLRGPYPSADPETLAKLNPQVVIVLKPDAPADSLSKASQFWARLDASPRRVYVLNEKYVLLPGAHVADLAEAMQRCLYPDGSR
jgi:ABC-type Fe3+-hydroxamate transport system substrate-binding protein